MGRRWGLGSHVMVWIGGVASGLFLGLSLQTTAAQGDPVHLKVPPAPGSGPDARPADTLEAEVIDLVNAARRQADCAPLRVDGRLQAAARSHSAAMARAKSLTHDGPWVRLKRAGYRWGGAENLAKGYHSPDELVDEWMASGAHRRNILDCRLRATGVGLHVAGRISWWTQEFGFR